MGYPATFEDKKLAAKTNEIIWGLYDAAMKHEDDDDKLVQLHIIHEYIIDELMPKYAALSDEVARTCKLKRPCEDYAVMYEWKAIVFHDWHTINGCLDCKHCYAATEVADVYRFGGKAKNPELFYPILGEKFVSERNYKDAIECYKKAGNDHKGRLSELIKNAEVSMGKPNEEEKKNDEKKNQEAAKSPKKNKDAKKSEKKNEEPQKSDNKNEEAEKSDKKKNEEAEKSEKKNEEGTKDVKNDRMEPRAVGFSLIAATERQIRGFEELNKLCSEHGNLLSVFHLASRESSDDELMVEKVCPIEDYFEKEFTKNFADCGGQVTSKMWWDHIEKKFQRIFRGVIQGLIYLYRNGKVCGNLYRSDMTCCNIFVTAHSGEGRTLPSLDPEQKADNDVTDLVVAMTSWSSLLNLNVPMFLLIDHPYFWTIEERVIFMYRWHRVVKRDRLRDEIIGACEVMLSEYDEWWTILDGRYKEIYKKAENATNAVSPYRHPIDIIRFYHAAYTHVNDKEYGGHVVAFSDAQIDKDLTKFFPSYYIDMFEAFCHCVQINGVEQMAAVTNFRFNDSGFMTEMITRNWVLGVAMTEC
ncbi:hypothetical protein OROGR_012415 [Orobanche gracilis]